MWLFSSIKSMIIGFLLIVLLVAILFWLYLNVQASMNVSAQYAQIQLSQSLPTKINVGNYLETHAQGALNTHINLDRKLSLPLRGRYLAELDFAVITPVSVSIDYATKIKINTVMPLETTTDLIYQNKLLPKFPLKLDIPIHLEVPFQIQRTYNIPIKIMFDGPVHFEFDEHVDLHIKHIFNPVLNMNDKMTMKKIVPFNATMYNVERQTLADLEMKMEIPLKNIHP
ncbi:hypothetical protein [Acinetobacter stercoris]|uniref:Uncharacterized protein n=1 Tax=Acinetobacter stercoris TaxID=2126983 RepID=A0A2U3MWQ9_9GAMM|nr:hypothetical protein [Acinetobacter stercoris]SPL69868.1 hypothetical protein KPC_1046 [Acinetobacter stercoris]